MKVWIAVVKKKKKKNLSDLVLQWKYLSTNRQLVRFCGYERHHLCGYFAENAFFFQNCIKSPLLVKMLFLLRLISFINWSEKIISTKNVSKLRHHKIQILLIRLSYWNGPFMFLSRHQRLRNRFLESDTEYSPGRVASLVNRLIISHWMW